MQSNDNGSARRMGRPPVSRPLCPQCGVQPLKRARAQFCGKACSNAARAIPPLDRFLTSCEDRPDLPLVLGMPCIDWVRNFSGDGYPAFTISHDQNVGAHRYAYALARSQRTGESLESVLASGVHVGHVCDRPACVQASDEGTYKVRGRIFPRYGHLIGMDSRANTHDKIDKGRSVNVQGSDHGMAKIDESIVHDVDLLWAQGKTQEQIGLLYDLTQKQVSGIIKRTYWKHIPILTPAPNGRNPWGKITPEIKAAIFADRAAGMRQQAIAVKYGIDQTSVSRILRQLK